MSANTEVLSEKKRKHDRPHPESKPSKKVKKISSGKTTSKLNDSNINGSNATQVSKGSMNGSLGMIMPADTEAIPNLSTKSKKQKRDRQKLDTQPQKDEHKSLIKTEKKLKKSREIPHQAASVETPSQAGQILDQQDIPSLSKAKHEDWTISSSIGDVFRRLDPVFSGDSGYLLLATRQGINIYSVITSLLIRKITLVNANHLVGFKLSIYNQDNVILALSDGSIQTWNWTTADLLSDFNIDCQILTFDITTNPKDGADRLVLSTKAEDNHAGSRIGLVTISSETLTGAAFESLHESPEQIIFLQCFSYGRSIFAASQTRVTISYPVKRRWDHLNWKTFAFPERLTRFSVFYQLRGRATGDAQINSEEQKQHHYSLALASIGGVIYVYQDILASLMQNIPLNPQRLHWHRSAVGAVAWSKDGNYLISGGSETVLNLWQLDTNKLQHLPNMTSAIQNITVSPAGTSYAVHLAENSTLVLSTSELAPLAVMAGIQTRSVATPISKDNACLVPRIPITLNPLQNGEILVAVGTALDARASPFIQSFDVSLGRNVSRQALARNNVITTNQAPKGGRISEANITHITTSTDGKWLASVDEWSPPEADISYVTTKDKASLIESREVQKRRETYLKFWSWSEDDKGWILQARIDLPHQSDISVTSSKVLDLVAIPDQTGFTTVGEDGVVRIWQPKTRLRDGRVVRGVKEGVTTWSCSSITDIGRTSSDLEVIGQGQFHNLPTSAKLAYSHDGSVLAVAFNDVAKTVHFINAAASSVQASQPSMYLGDLAGIKFLDKSLIILSSGVYVWDTIFNKLIYEFGLPSADSAFDAKSQLRHLAVNTHTKTFTICHSIQHKGETGSRIQVFSPASSTPLLVSDRPYPTTALLSMQSQTGFVAIDSSSDVRLIKPKTSTTVDAGVSITVSQINGDHDEDMLDVADDISVEEDHPLQLTEPNTKPGAEEGSEADDDDQRLVRATDLANVFDDKPSFALPPLQDLFHAVASLYLGKQGARLKTKSSSSKRRTEKGGEKKKAIQIPSLPVVASASSEQVVAQ